MVQRAALIASIFIGLFSVSSHSGVTFQGRIVQTGTGQPLESALVNFTFEVRSPSPEDCLLYREVHALNMNNSKGLFTLILGGGAPTGPAIGLTEAFSPVGSYTGLTCGDGSTSWNSDPTDKRVLRVTAFDGVTTFTIADNSDVEEVPYAMHASTLGGIDKDGFIKVNASGASLTQANVEQVFSTTNFPELIALLNGTSTRYAKSSDLPVSGGILNMTGGGVRVPDTPPTNDSAVNKNYSDGYIAGRRIDGPNLSGLANGESLRWDSTANSGVGGWVRYTPVDAGAVVNSVVGAGPIAVTGTTNVTVDLDYGNGLTVSGGTLQAQAGSGILVDGTGIRADVGTAAGQVMGAGAVPSCLPSEKLQMSAGPTFVWSCVSDVTGSSLPAAAGTAAAPGYAFSGDTNTGMFGAAADQIGFSTSGSERVRITADGRVVIGATSPHPLGAHLLDVVMPPNTSSDTAFLMRRSENTFSGVMTSIVPAGTPSDSNVAWDYGMPFSSNSFVIRTFNNSTNVNRLIITNAGNVGINESNPATALDVNGAVRVGTTATTCAAPVAGAIRYNSGVMEYCNGTTWTAFTTGSSLPAAAGSAGAPGYAFSGDANTGMFGAAADQIGFSTNGSERIRIDNNGRVGIGSTTMAERLEVNGAIRIGNSSGTGAGTIRWDGTNFQGYTGTSWVNLSGSAAPGTTNCDTTQTFTTAGTYTYNVPANFGTITIRMWGGGGGGGGSNTQNGTNGGSSTINSLGLSAGGGFGGTHSGTAPGTGGAGGTAVGGTININGSPGTDGTTATGGSGGNAPGGGGLGGVGSASANNTAGASPGGGGGGGVVSSRGGGGGGSGAYVEKTFTPATLIPGTSLNDIIVGTGSTSATCCDPLNKSGAGTGLVTITCSSTGTPPMNDRALVFMDGATYSNSTNLVYSASGNLGVGTANPAARLDVDGAIKVGSSTTCDMTTAGSIRYNGTAVQFCDGALWQTLSTGSGSVTGVDATAPLASSGGANPTISLSGSIPIANGGTGATTAADARTNLGLGTAAVANIGTGAGNVMAADGVPNCAANEKLQMSLGPVFAWSCVADQTGTSSQWTTSGSDIYYSTGNVGIGTTSPQERLEVTGNIRAASSWGSIDLQTSGGFPSIAMVGSLNGVGSPGITFGPENSGAFDTRLYRSGTNTLRTPGGLLVDGNVGIGTTSPQTALDVNGAVRIGTTATTCAAPIAGAVRYNAGVVQYCNGTAWTSFTTGSSFLAASGTAAAPGFAFSGDTNTGMFGAAADQIGFSTNGSERVRIDNNGRLGIGVTSLTEMLEVAGAIRVGNSSGTGAGTIRWDGTSFQGYTGSAWVALNGSAQPGTANCDTTVTFSTAGTYVYNVPASFGTITIRLWGGGGGGGGGNNSGFAGSTGTPGGSSTISSLGLFAGGGGAGVGHAVAGTGSGGAGGVASGGTVNTNGDPGGSGISSPASSGAGGSSPNGGAGGALRSSPGNGASGASPGGGGGGAIQTGQSGGGGAGAYVEKTYTQAQLLPGTSINDIVVGAGGAGGNNVSSGGSGGTGRVTVACTSSGAPPTNDRAVVFMNGSSYSNTTNFIYTATGQLGVGTSSPEATLDVNGAIKSTAGDAGSSTTIDFASGNLQYTTANCGAMVLNNVKSGGTYSLAVQGAGGGTCSFTAYSGSGTTGPLTVRVSTNVSLVQSPNKHVIFTFMVMGGTLYVAAIDGY